MPFKRPETFTERNNRFFSRLAHLKSVTSVRRMTSTANYVNYEVDLQRQDFENEIVKLCNEFSDEKYVAEMRGFEPIGNAALGRFYRYTIEMRMT